jgi:hypothetical protein
MKDWLEYFEWNRANRRHIPWEQAARIGLHLRKPLIRSLQRFQVGESGEGSHLRKQAATTGCPIYQKCIDLFIKEEQEHARLMAEILKREQAPLLTHHWSDNCFILLRRLFRLEHELLVLLVPEIIAKRYFRALHEGAEDPVVRAVCHQVLHDEEGHVAFHVDYLRQAFRSVSLVKRMALMISWKLLFQVACMVVMLDHGSLLRAIGVYRATFWWDCLMLLDEAAAAIFSSVSERRDLGSSTCQGALQRGDAMVSFSHVQSE